MYANGAGTLTHSAFPVRPTSKIVAAVIAVATDEEAPTVRRKRNPDDPVMRPRSGQRQYLLAAIVDPIPDPSRSVPHLPVAILVESALQSSP